MTLTANGKWDCEKCGNRYRNQPCHICKPTDEYKKKHSSVLRCDYTNNPCGTDTLPKGEVCKCYSCFQWRSLNQNMSISKRPIITASQGDDHGPYSMLIEGIDY